MTGAGFGGAGRGATGAQWARCMIMMMAMQGWGKPGVNFGCLEVGVPHDLNFYFPGYADGGMSGDLAWTANAVNNYQRMPHILTMNPVKQMVPRQELPDAIINGIPLLGTTNPLLPSLQCRFYRLFGHKNQY